MMLQPSTAYCSLTPLGLNLHLVTGKNQACSQRKGTPIFSQVPPWTNNSKTLSVMEVGNNFHPWQHDWVFTRMFYRHHSRENFGEAGEAERHERFVAGHPNATHSPTGIHLQRTCPPEPGYFTDGKTCPKPLRQQPARETLSSSKACWNQPSSTICFWGENTENMPSNHIREMNPKVVGTGSLVRNSVSTRPQRSIGEICAARTRALRLLWRSWNLVVSLLG